MFDAWIRPRIDRPLDAAARALAPTGLQANAVTLCGLAVGLGAVPLLAQQRYGAALACILANRLLDGVDGAIARQRGPTDFGGFLDAVCDFLFYAAVPLGFALGRAEHAPFATLLVFSFMGTASTFLTFAAIAGRRGIETDLRGKKAFYYLGGLTEGTETIVAFALFCLFPDAFPLLASAFAALCGVTTLTRILAARELLHAPDLQRSHGASR